MPFDDVEAILDDAIDSTVQTCNSYLREYLFNLCKADVDKMQAKMSNLNDLEQKGQNQH